MTMLVNRLNKRVRILKPSKMRDEFGEPVNDLVEVCTVWAAIEPLRGREFFAALQENAEVTVRIRIRYRDGIDRTMFVEHKGTIYEIMHIIHPELNRKELQFMCKERQ